MHALPSPHPASTVVLLCALAFDFSAWQAQLRRDVLGPYRSCKQDCGKARDGRVSRRTMQQAQHARYERRAGGLCGVRFSRSFRAFPLPCVLEAAIPPLPGVLPSQLSPNTPRRCCPPQPHHPASSASALPGGDAPAGAAGRLARLGSQWAARARRGRRRRRLALGPQTCHASGWCLVVSGCVLVTRPLLQENELAGV